MASTSHELHTPLNTMLGATDIVDSTTLESEQRDAPVQVRSAGKHLMSLVNTMIDLSRIETGALQIHTHPINLNDELDTLHAIMLPDAQMRRVELTLNKGASPATLVMGDAIRLQEVLLHLLKVMICTASVRVAQSGPEHGSAIRHSRFSLAHASIRTGPRRRRRCAVRKLQSGFVPNISCVDGRFTN
ncbi:MAG: phosphoglycerate-specific signal transduction histidine kinase [Gammaproteobacteria bacterium]|jgi:phosphoglycerate-specific signal transduction histidine kinase